MFDALTLSTWSESCRIGQTAAKRRSLLDNRDVETRHAIAQEVHLHEHAAGAAAHYDDRTSCRALTADCILSIRTRLAHACASSSVRSSMQAEFAQQFLPVANEAAFAPIAR